MRLLFICAHPAIDPGIRTALMLQAVLGLSAERIGRAFLVPGPTIGQRLVRAKERIRDAGIPFAMPDPEDMPERLGDALEAIYADFGAGWDDLHAYAETGRDLVEEALYLARLVVAALPGEAEPKGLLALILHCEARRPARSDSAGRFVPLSEQDRDLWHRPMIVEAEALLRAAAGSGRIRRFQIEAAIHSVHAQRTATDQPNGWALLQFYDHLARLTQGIGAQIGRAVAHADHGDPNDALSILDALPLDPTSVHQPYWVARAHVLQAVGRQAEATQAREPAIALTADPAVRRFLVAGRRAGRPGRDPPCTPPRPMRAPRRLIGFASAQGG